MSLSRTAQSAPAGEKPSERRKFWKNNQLELASSPSLHFLPDFSEDCAKNRGFSTKITKIARLLRACNLRKSSGVSLGGGETR
jgi:hypothetical protein